LSTIIHTLFLQTHSLRCPIAHLIRSHDTKTVIADLWRSVSSSYCAAEYTKRYYLLAGSS